MTKFFIGFGVVSVLLASIMGLFLHEAFNAFKRQRLEAVRTLNAQGSVLSRAIGDELGERYMDTHLFTLVALDRLDSAPLLSKALEKRVHSLNLFELVIFVDANGKYFASTLTDTNGDKVNIEALRRAIAREPMAQTSETISIQKDDRWIEAALGKGNREFRISVPLKSEKGELLGHVISYARRESFREVLQGVDLSLKEHGLETINVEIETGSGEPLFALKSPLDLPKGEDLIEINSPVDLAKLSSKMPIRTSLVFNKKEVFKSIDKSEAEFKNLFAALSVFCLLVLGGVFVMFRYLLKVLELRNAESERARTLAERASKAKSEFLAVMTHEIRTPINGVIGAASLLNETKLSDDQGDLVAIIRNSSNLLLTLVNDILDFSKIEAERFALEASAFKLNALVEEIYSSFMLSARTKGLELEIDCSFKFDGLLVGDSFRIKQVLINFLSNAIKFTEAGSVTLNVRQVARTDGSFRVRFEVRDQGIGITKENLKKVFALFEQAEFSTTRKYGGTGLGLSISKKLVEMMGGEIGVESVIGLGSTFWFELSLPLAHPDRFPISPVTAVSSDFVIPTDLAVLVVEDNMTNQVITSRYLNRMNIRDVALASDGVEAVRMVKEKDFGLILMDSLMPNKDGCEAAREIRAFGGKFAKVPIIALTANGTSGDVDKCMKAGMNDFLSKPIDRVPFELVIRKWCAVAPTDIRKPEAG